jgi:hypothetical protein
MKFSDGRAYKLLGIFAILLLSFSAVSCLTIETVEHPDAAGRWKYRVNITKPHTENEGRAGHLFFRGRELPGCFNTIIIGKTKYDYRIRINPSDFSGYARDPGYVPPPSTSTLKLTPEELKRGWYFAAADQRRQDTPADWIWVKRENLEAFVKPDKVYTFIDKYKLNPKPENQEAPFSFRLMLKS